MHMTGRRESKEHSKKRTFTNKLESINLVDASPYLNEMKFSLDSYKTEIEESIKSNSVIQHESFKKNFYNSLENLIHQILNIKDKKLREAKIETIYKWFDVKSKFFKSLNPINLRTDKNFYESYPAGVNNNIKSDYYEAQNFPLDFEREHRTEEGGLLPPKDRLKEYKTKKIAKEKEKDNKETKLDKDDLFKDSDFNTYEKQRLQSATSSVALRSTFYTANQTQSKFPTPWNMPNVELPFDPVREIKSSYSYQRPKYEYSNLVIEKNTIQAKNRELADKRNQEEMKEFMNEFGLNRARFSEEIEKKFATRHLIKHYEGVVRSGDDSNLEGEDDNDENLENKEYKLKTVFVQSESNLLLLRGDLKVNKESFIKVNTNNIKNLGPENKINVNSEEVRVNIRVKENPDRESNIGNIFIKYDKLPSEMTARMKSVDPIFNARQTYSKMLDVKEIDQSKNEYKKHYKPLSAYDNSNINVMTPNFKKKQNKTRSSTCYEFIKNNFRGDNLLRERKTLTGFKMDDYSKLKDTLMKYNNTTVCFASLKSAFLPTAEEVKYPKFYLPNAGSGLLSRPVEVVPKNRPRSINKKK